MSVPCAHDKTFAHRGTWTGTPLGSTLAAGDPALMDRHVFGMVLMNDWSARDIQKYEYVPLGPFTGKNFGTTVSPWVVTIAAMEPYLSICSSGSGSGHGDGDELSPHLVMDAGKRRMFDINLEVGLASGKHPEIETIVSRSNFKNLHWSIEQVFPY